MAIEAMDVGPFDATDGLTNYEVQWQVCLQKHPSTKKATDWRDLGEIMNQALETSWQNNIIHITVSAEGVLDPHTQNPHGDWKIDLQKMQQRNEVSGTVRMVRRMLVSIRSTQ
jgi:hypothetical protein